MTESGGICSFNIPSLNCHFDKASKKDNLSVNIINNSTDKPVFFDLTTQRHINSDETRKLLFRRKVYEEITETSLQKYYNFQRKVQALEESKKILQKKSDALANRIKNFEPFIEENNYRYRRTCEYAKEDIKTAKNKHRELRKIQEEVSKLTLRKSFFIEANTKLKTYEDFLLNTLNLLPSDYVKGLKENNMKALLRRCDALFIMNRATYGDLQKSSNTIRELKDELDLCFVDLSKVQTEQSLIFPKMQNKNIICQDDLRAKMTAYSEAYIVLRNKMHTFGLIIQSVNNIANKCFEMIMNGYYGFRDLTVLPKIMMMDPKIKFRKIEEYISSAMLILDLVKDYKSDPSD